MDLIRTYDVMESFQSIYVDVDIDVLAVDDLSM
jgi:hypothetical protein